MGNVVLSPNIKKTSDRIDLNGNVINKRTKAVIEKVEEEYIPPVTTENPLVETRSTSKIDNLINKKVEAKIEEIINRKVEEALSKL